MENQQPTTTTTISVKLTDCDTNHEGSDNFYRLHIKHNYDHSHEVESTKSWNFLEKEKTIKLRLLIYFDSGLTPSRAKRKL